MFSIFRICCRENTPQEKYLISIKSYAECRFKHIADSNSELIWETDGKGLYTYGGSALQKIVGYAPEEVVGKKHLYDFFVPGQVLMGQVLIGSNNILKYSYTSPTYFHYGDL